VRKLRMCNGPLILADVYVDQGQNRRPAAPNLDSLSVVGILWRSIQGINCASEVSRELIDNNCSIVTCSW